MTPAKTASDHSSPGRTFHQHLGIREPQHHVTYKHE